VTQRVTQIARALRKKTAGGGGGSARQH
jgi:hypothetical protein